MANIHRPARSFMVLPGMRPAYTADPKHPGEQRLPGFGWLPNRARGLFISMLGEFVGTFLFLFFAYAGTQVANTRPSNGIIGPTTSTLLYIALAFGFSLAVNVWIFFRISGGIFNPAVTVALALVGAVAWAKAACLIVAQLLGAISAAGIVSALFPGPLKVRTTLSPETSVTRGLFIEAFLTAELIFTIFMLAAEKHRATFLAPIGIGLALFIAELAGVYFTGGSLNPARSFGPDVVLGHFNGYHWLYWIGPLIGAIMAVVFYRFIKFLEYQTANPGADSDGLENGHFKTSEVRNGPGQSSRQTDGTHDIDMERPILPIHELSKETGKPISPDSEKAQTSSPLHAGHSCAMDGHHSETDIDHPNDRPRAHHRQNSRSRSEQSYRGGPAMEMGA